MRRYMLYMCCRFTCESIVLRSESVAYCVCCTEIMFMVELMLTAFRSVVAIDAALRGRVKLVAVKARVCGG